MFGLEEGMKNKCGTFVGNGSHKIDISCPFEPDIVILWSDELDTNPGIDGGCFIAGTYITGTGYWLIRWNNATTANVSGGGGCVKTGIGYQYMSYTNGILKCQIGSGGNKSFFYADGYTYNYILLKRN